MSAQARQLLLELLSPVVAEHDGFLEDVEVRAAGRRTLVRLLVDRDGGIDLDEVAKLSRAVSELLDVRESELPFGEYVLEVSSPGVDRPLTQARHFERNIGRLLSITDTAGASITGRLTAFADDVLTLQLKTGEKTINLADVAKARVEVEFNPGSGKAAPVVEGDENDVFSEYTAAPNQAGGNSSQSSSSRANPRGNSSGGANRQSGGNKPRTGGGRAPQGSKPGGKPNHDPRNKQGGTR